MKSLGAYVSIGLRKELMEEPTIDLDSSPYECQPVIMLLLVSMQDGEQCGNLPMISEAVRSLYVHSSQVSI